MNGIFENGGWFVVLGLLVFIAESSVRGAKLKKRLATERCEKNLLMVLARRGVLTTIDNEVRKRAAAYGKMANCAEILRGSVEYVLQKAWQESSPDSLGLDILICSGWGIEKAAEATVQLLEPYYRRGPNWAQCAVRDSGGVRATLELDYAVTKDMKDDPEGFCEVLRLALVSLHRTPPESRRPVKLHGYKGVILSMVGGRPK